MDATQALKDAENSLRDFIFQILEGKYKEEWLLRCWASEKRISEWEERRNEERTKFWKTTAIDERLLYYADFRDLSEIMKENWSLFSDAFWEHKKFKPYLDMLWGLRNPDAHRRELFPHQKSLIIGIAGEIRTMIVRYRNKNENINDYFPRLECVRENLWRIWLPNDLSSEDKEISVRVGDAAQFLTSSPP